MPVVYELNTDPVIVPVSSLVESVFVVLVDSGR